VKEPDDLMPNPRDPKYADGGNADFMADWGAWNRREAVREMEKKQAEKAAKEATERAQSEAAREAEEARIRLTASLERARAEHPDFDEIIRAADSDARLKKIPAPPAYVQEMLSASDHPAQITHYLVTHPEEARKLFELSPKRAALALGRLETRFEKEAAAPIAATPAAPAAPSAAPAPAAGTNPTPNISKAPPPMPSLAGGSADVIVDPTRARNFQEYKQLRLQEQRRSRGR
jgi:hypothetical protein